MGRRRKGRSINGILLVDKHQGESSNAIVQQIKRLFGAAKAGHTGALDPLATGMLPVCLGEATKFSQFLLEADKTYEVEAQLGVRTDTSDADGQVVQTRAVKLDEAQVIAALAAFRGKIQQVPSMFSALKHQGQPLYHYARQGIDIPREPRDIEIYSNTLLHFENDSLRLRIHCSKGTYIRTIVDDLGEALGCGAHVRELRRLKVADFPEQMRSVADYQSLVSDITDTEAHFPILDTLLLPMDTPVLSLPRIELDSADTRKLQNGQAIPNMVAEDIMHEQAIRVYGPDQVFLGVAQYSATWALQPKRLVVY